MKKSRHRMLKLSNTRTSTIKKRRPSLTGAEDSTKNQAFVVSPALGVSNWTTFSKLLQRRQRTNTPWVAQQNRLMTRALHQSLDTQANLHLTLRKSLQAQSCKRKFTVPVSIKRDSISTCTLQPAHSRQAI